MKKIALLTDSSCDLDFKTIEEYNIKVVPFRIIYKDREYLDQLTISSEELYNSLETEVPTTSLPNLDYADKMLRRLVSEGYTDVIVVTVSSNLSGTFNSLQILSEHHEELNFHFFDSRTLGFPVGAIVLEIAKLLNDKLELEDIKSRLESIRARVHGYITFKTLEFLRRGGRIGRVAGTVGEILNLKPVVSSNEEGVLYTYCKCRGRKQSIAKIKEIVNEYLDKGKCRIWVLSGAAYEEAKAFFEDIKKHHNISEISLESIGASMGVHTGPGALGVCILEEEKQY